MTSSETDDSWWLIVSPLLDEAFELNPTERAAWLIELRQRDAAVAQRVEQLLAQHAQLSEAKFLENAPQVDAGDGAHAGDRVGAYALVEPLGRGGMGAVWLAQRADGHFEGRAAVKLLDVATTHRPADARFVREGNVLAQLQHPNIAHLIDAGIAANGQPFLVLEYVDGLRIDRFCDDHTLDTRARVELFLLVLAAVAHAHGRLIVHFDLKPANILITPQGEVKLLDFGIAALLSSARRDEPGAATLGMTPLYAAPEQLTGAQVTTATDVYALGMVLYRLLARRHPWDSSGVHEVSVAALLTIPLMPPSELMGDTTLHRTLRGDLDAIVMKALAREPADRYGSVDALNADLRRYLDIQPVLAHVQSLRYRARKFLHRNRGSVLGASLAALALLTTTTVALVQMLEARQQRDVAREQTARAEGFDNVITSLLSQGGPDGSPLTARELLDKATVEIERRYASEPKTLVHMLIVIAGRYYDLRDSNREYAVELRAAVVAAKAHDAALLLEVQCNTVETEVNLGHREAALRRMQQAQSLMREVNNIDPVIRADCLRNSAELAWNSGARDLARKQVDEALDALRPNNETVGNRYTGLLSMRAAFSDDLVDAHRRWLELRALQMRQGRGDSISGYIGRSGVARSFLMLGQVRTARKLMEADAPGLVATPMRMPPAVLPLWFYAEILLRNHEPQRAVVALDRVIATAREGGSEGLVVRSSLARGRAAMQLNDVVGAQTRLVEAGAIMQRMQREEPWWYVDYARLAVAIDLAHADTQAADREVAAAFAHVDDVRDARNPYVAPLLVLRAQIRLQDRANDAALMAAREAAQRFAENTLDANLSADVGEAQLLIARALAAKRDVQGARTEAVQARNILARSLGEDDASTRAAAELLAAREN